MSPILRKYTKPTFQTSAKLSQVTAQTIVSGATLVNNL